MNLHPASFGENGCEWLCLTLLNIDTLIKAVLVAILVLHEYSVVVAAMLFFHLYESIVAVFAFIRYLLW